MLCQAKNANARCNMSFVLVPRWPAALLGTAQRAQTVSSTPLSSSPLRRGKGDGDPRHDDTALEEIMDPDAPRRRRYAHAAL